MRIHTFAFLTGIILSFNIFSQTKPNFVFITIDDQNDWVQGFSGHPQAASPNIQFLEKKGTTFTNAYAPAPQCAPSRTSMITGKDCDYTQVYHNNLIKCSNFRYNFREELGNATVFTIPEILKDSAGYFTYSISKVMHCHDKFADYDLSNPIMCDRGLSWNKAIIFDENGEENDVTDYGMANEEGVFEYACTMIPDSMEKYMQDFIATDSAIDFINDYALHPENYCDKPFFLGLGFRRPHSPLYIPEKYFLGFYNTDYYSIPYDLPYNDPVGMAPYNGVVMPPQPVPMWSDYDALPVDGVAHALVDASPVHQGVFIWSNSTQATFGLPYISAGMSEDERDFAMEEAKRANMVMSYLAATKFVDAQIGRFIDAMKTHPEIYNNTIFIVLGDHGYSMGEKSHWKKGALWETDIRVPLVIADMRAPVKKTCKRFVNFIDLFPTICDMAGVDYPTFPDGSPYLDGFSLTPLIANPNTPWDRPILSSFINGADKTIQGACFPQYSVRDDEWQYIKYTTNGAGFPVSCDEATAEIQEELYHIGKKKNIDPYEWTNLADNPAYAATKNHLASFLPGGINYLQFERSDNESISATDEGISFYIYPNPANDHAVFSIENAEEGKAELMITDLIGKIISTYDLEIPEGGYTQITFNTIHLTAGYYIATLKQNTDLQTMKFAVIR